MATFIGLINYTDQGIANIKDSPKRLDAARETARQFGAELKDVYLTMGAYDLVTILEAPDDEAATKFLLAVSSRGSVRTTTLRAFTETEYRAIVAALP